MAVPDRGKIFMQKSKMYGLMFALVSLGMLAFLPAFSGALLPAAFAATPNATGTCPSQAFLSTTNVPAGHLLILNVYWTVRNDEDSGFAGYWAMDHFTTHLKVWD